jgi:hypothetical protein
MERSTSFFFRTVFSIYFDYDHGLATASPVSHVITRGLRLHVKNLQGSNRLDDLKKPRAAILANKASESDAWFR